MRVCVSRSIAFAVLLMAFLSAAPSARAQAPAPARVVGTVSAISGNTMTVRTDAGDVYQVVVPVVAVVRQIEPGQKTLADAKTIQLSDLSSGDRVLVGLDPNAPAGTSQALTIIAVKQSELARKQEQEREEWQRNGVGGLVKSVDPQTGAIVLTSGAGPTAKTLTVRTTSATVLKRYAPASVNYDQAKPAPLTAISPGDQLRARGTKNADGTEIDAEEVVSGSFRNISGTVTSLDAGNSMLVVKDLATKQQVSIHITPDTQMHQLPERMATMLAAILKGGGQQGQGAGRPGGYGASGNGGGGQGGGQGRGPGGDLQQMLVRAPAIPLTDLKKGDAVMLVSTQGTSDVTAITLLAGVEPLLEAPASQDLLANWSMDTSGGADQAGAQ
jgi:uncharacterized membrane protein YgcG